MSQTAVDPKGQPVAFAGLVADSDSWNDCVSSWSEEASASMKWGTGVIQGTAEQGILIPTGSGNKVKGILAFSFMHAPGGAAGFGDLDATGLIAGGRARVLRHGRIWVLVDKSVTVIAPYSDRPFMRYTADGSVNPQVGAWGIATDSGKNLDLTKVGMFTSPMVTLADGTKIARLEVNFTNLP